MGEEGKDETHLSRRSFVVSTGLLGAGVAARLPQIANAQAQVVAAGAAMETVASTVTVNGKPHRLTHDTRTTLLDALRETMELTGSKKGCDHGQCGACTVIVEGRRVNSCLTLLASVDGCTVTTVEGLAKGEELSPVQTAFMVNDGFQCGYCTPGQLCSATAAVEEAKKGVLTQVSWEAGLVRQDGQSGKALLTEDEIRERMSGNICRCGAYPGIVAAVRSAAMRAGVSVSVERAEQEA